MDDTDTSRCIRILDALETRYHKSRIGRFPHNASSIIEMKKNLSEGISYSSIYKMNEIGEEYLATTFISSLAQPGLGVRFSNRMSDTNEQLMVSKTLTQI